MTLNITVPVFNEEKVLLRNVRTLRDFVAEEFRCASEILIADNGSTDRTLEIAHGLAAECPEIRVLHLAEKGRGRALKAAWLSSEADVLAYMDADLSTDLGALPALVEPLFRCEYELATGSRLLDPRLTTRCFKRELISRCYNALAKRLLQTPVSDLQCGFKAITRAAARRLLPLVEDNNWFFDTEFLVRAQEQGCRILELPVRWVEDRHSHVRILRTALEDVRGLLRLRRNLRRASSPIQPQASAEAPMTTCGKFVAGTKA